MSETSDGSRGFCTNCGAQNDSSNRFCKECGTQLGVQSGDTGQEHSGRRVERGDFSAGAGNTFLGFFGWLYKLWKTPLRGWRRAARVAAIPTFLFLIYFFILNLPTDGLVATIYGLILRVPFIFLPSFGIAYLFAYEAENRVLSRGPVGMLAGILRELRQEIPRKVALAVFASLGVILSILLIVDVISALNTTYEVIDEDPTISGEINSTYDTFYEYHYVEVQVENRGAIQDYEDSLYLEEYDSLPASSEYDCLVANFYSEATGELLRASVYSKRFAPECEVYLEEYERDYGSFGG